jgi:hypothetical protein
MRWLDVIGKVTGTNHAVHRHWELFATLVDALEEAITAGARVTLGGPVACRRPHRRGPRPRR